MLFKYVLETLNARLLFIFVVALFVCFVSDQQEQSSGGSKPCRWTNWSF